MPYITREDGEHFVIPSYRDVIFVKKPSLLRREIISLSESYGEYIALQRNGVNQYEVAFSSEPGYLLGETIWSYFKRPENLIYCELIPNTTEAILVIVKSGSVYLDGSFPVETIPDELVSLKTQKIAFEIYTYGDVPISITTEPGKFVFEIAAVKSFTQLENPVFPTLPLVKAFQLQLVTTILRERGIGTFPVKNIIIAIVILLLIWLAWFLFINKKEEVVIPQIVLRAANPYQSYINSMNSPDPAAEVHWFSQEILLLLTIPGWYPASFDYSEGNIRIAVKSIGAKTDLLYDWAAKNKYTVEVATDGLYLTTRTRFPTRGLVSTINPLNHVITSLLDRLAFILPGNNLSIGALTDRFKYSERQIMINFSNITPDILELIGQKLQNLPLVLGKVSIIIANGSLTGSITLKALGN